MIRGAGRSTPIYLDHNATTPVAVEVIEAMRSALRDGWGNPSSAHATGRAARRILDSARGEVARLLGANPEEIVFTSGGTESDNLAILGVARARGPEFGRVVISAIEHPAVEKACGVLAAAGREVVRIPVDGDGVVDADAFCAALTPDTAIASLMLANNETGALQPVARVAQAARRMAVPLHTDAAQAIGKLPVDVADLGVDLLTVAGHKLYGPKGVGALYVRHGTEVASLLHGAPQERGQRPGTENTPGIAGLGAACALAGGEMSWRVDHGRALVARLLDDLRHRLGELPVNGPADPGRRLPNTLNVSLPGAPAADLLARLTGVATAAGAACHAGSTAPSAVLGAMGLSAERATSALRLSLGRGNTEEEIDTAAELIAGAATAVRRGRCARGEPA
ncbi:MAG: cysteine desulfurase family protein [Acidobacteriota bacterium]